MRRLVAIGVVAIFLAFLPPARAALVYVRPPSSGTTLGVIVVARNDGSAPRVIARGEHPLISPNGKWVVYFSRLRRGGDSLRIVPARGGRSRLLARHAFAPTPGPPFAWSPDSRRVAVGDAESPGGLIIDITSGKQRFVALDFQFDGASFSPDGSSVVIDNGDLRTASLLLVRLGSARTRRFAARSDYAVWVRGGIVFASAGIQLLPRPGARRQTLYPYRGQNILISLTGSADGRTVLVAQGASLGALQPVVINPRAHKSRTLPLVFSDVAALSRHGKLVLGAMNGNVVQASLDGRTRVLATGAMTPSWNR